jgi:PAS domain S-box-containing protein
MRRGSIWTLRRTIAVALATATLPLLVAAVLEARQNERNARARAVGEAAARAGLVAATLDARIEGIRAALVPLAEHPAVRAQDAAACDALFGRLRDELPYAANLSAYRVDGTAFASGIHAPPINVSDRDWFREALDATAPRVSDLVIGRYTHQPIVVVSTPVRAAGGLPASVVAISVRGARLLQDLAADGAGGTVAVVDSRGVVIAAAPPDAATVGGRLPAELESVAFAAEGPIGEGPAPGGGVALARSVVRLRAAPWRVLVSAAPPRATPWEELAGWSGRMFAAAVLAVLAALAVARSGLRRIERLARDADRLARGERPAPLAAPLSSAVAGYGELEPIARALGRLVAAEDAARESVEAEVRRLEATNRVIRTIAGGRDPAAVMSDVLRELAAAAPVAGIALHALASGGGSDEIVARAGASGEGEEGGAPRLRLEVQTALEPRPHALEVVLAGPPLDDAARAVLEAVAAQIGAALDTAYLIRRHAEAEARYRTVLENVPACVFTATVAEKRKIEVAGGSLERLLGYSEADPAAFLEGWAEQVHPDDRAAIAERWERAQRTGLFVSEHRLRRKDGAYIWVDIRARVQAGPGGVTGLHGVAIDVTERREALNTLERRTRHLAALSEVARAVAHASDQGEVIREICAAVCSVFGYDTAAFFELDEAQGKLRMRFAANVPAWMAGRADFPLWAVPPLERAIATGGWCELGDLAAQPGELPAELVARLRARSVMAATVATGGRTIGVLAALAVRNRRVLEADERDLYLSLAGLAGGAIARTRLLAQVERDRTELRRLGAEALAATEAERGRVARELHDEAGQSLVALALRLDVLARTRGLPAEVTREAADLATVARAALNELRQLARDLRPAALDDLGLAEALRGLVRRFGREGPVVSLAIPEQLPRVAAATETALYRITQEAVANAIRHGHALKVQISLAVDGGCLRLEVRDDGRGFDPEEVREGIGLASMRERAKLVQGACDVISAPGAGTVIRVAVPIEGQAESGEAVEQAALAGADEVYEGTAP